jgi:PAS domain S-box-containing protein
MNNVIATDKSQIHITDLVDIDELRELFEAYSDTTGMVTALLDLEGKVLIATNWQDSCTKFHRQNDITSKRCLESDTALAGALEKGEQYVAYECKNGLVDVATPVVIEGEHLANFFTGQFFYESPDLDKFSEQAKAAGFDKEGYLNAIKNVPIYDHVTIEKHMKFLVRMAEVIAKTGASNLRNIHLNEALKEQKLKLEQQVKERTQELESTVKQQSLMAKGSRDGFWHWFDPDQDAVYWSENFFTLLGYEPQEFEPSFSFFQSMLHPDDVQLTLDAVSQAIQNKYTFDIEYRIRNKSGQYSWYRGRGTPYYNEEGTFVEMAGSIADISVNKQLEEKLRETNKALEQEQEKFTKFVNLAPVGIAINHLDDGRFEYVNSEFSRFSGYKVDELNSMDYWQLTPRMYEQQEQEQLTIMSETGRYGPYQKEYIHKAGHHYPVVLSGIRIKTLDGKDYIWSVVQDISEQQRHEEQLKVAKQNAEDAARIKSEFLANMSHEIRTPMNGIMGLTELLLGTELTHTQKEWAEALKVSAATLLTIINDILDLSKIESGKLNIESVPFNLTQLLQQIKKLSAVNASNKSLHFLVEAQGIESSDFIGDPTRIKQILLNLVNNAIKFTDKGSVSLKVSLNKQLSDKRCQIKFEVDDTGIGISPEQQHKLFDRFSQADSSTTRRFGGTGLGLNICKQLVELMNGKIYCDSTEGCGSAFWFILDLEYQSPAHQLIKNKPSVAFGLPSHETKNIKALLVEDNRINQLVAENMFKVMCIQSDTAENGHEALELLAKNNYDIIFMDCHMPVMDGFEATKQIRKDPLYQYLPIVALTAGAMESEHLKCINVGMNAVITKPFEANDIAQALELIKLS